MLKKYLKKIVLVIFLFSAVANFCLFSTCQAATGASEDLKTQMNNAATPSWGGIPTAGSSLSGIVAAVVKALLGLLGVIFLVLIIYAGFNWMTAQGDEEKVTLAKDTLTRAVIGLIIIIAAYSITYFVFSSLPGGGEGGTGGAQTGPVS